MTGIHMSMMNNTVTASASPAVSVVTANLQLYLDAANSASYPGSGTTWTDLSPNAYSTTLVGAPSWGNTFFTFDGTTEYVDTNQSLSAQAFTIGAWVRSYTAGIKMIISKETTAGWPWNYRLWMNGGQFIGDIAISGALNDGLGTPLTNYNNGSWYLAFFTRDDSNWYLYVNGVQVASKVDPFTGSITNAQEVWIGRSAFTQGGASPSGSYQYTGDIGQIFIYNAVLTSTQILQNYNATRATYGL